MAPVAWYDWKGLEGWSKTATDFPLISKAGRSSAASFADLVVSAKKCYTSRALWRLLFIRFRFY